MSNVQAYYDAIAADEWERLERHRTEFAVTRRAMAEFLPPPPASILDIGCGPGRYSIALAGQGYTLTLCDLSSQELALAQEHAREAGVTFDAVVQASACDLSALSSARFDAVLLMGPLYHLVRREDRLQAVAEARRLLRPGGILFASFICRFAPLRDAANKYPAHILEGDGHTERLVTTGIHVSMTGFADAHFAHPNEVTALMTDAGFLMQSMVGAEGVVAGHEDKINELSGELWEAWVDLNYRLGKDPALWGAADHLLYIGRPRG